MPALTRDEKKAVTRQRLLDAAARVIAEKGYRGATVDDIAEDAGLTKGAVYSNFQSKEDLFFALLDSRRITPDWSLLLDSELPLEDRLRRFGHHVVAVLRKPESVDEYPLELEFALLAYRDKRARKRVRGVQRANSDSVAWLLDELRSREGLSYPLPVDQMGAAFMALVRGLAHPAAHLGDSVFTPELVGEALVVFFQTSLPGKGVSRRRRGSRER